MRTKRWLFGLLALLLLSTSFAIAACGDDDDDSDSGSTSGEKTAAIQKDPAVEGVNVTVGSKNFTEQKVLGEIYAQGLQAAGFTVKKQLNLGDEKTAFKALKSGDIDAYPEYTGTALLSFFNVKANDIPKNPGTAFKEVAVNMKKEGVTAFLPTPFTSSNEVALTKKKADELGVKKISDLQGKDGDLTLYGSPECRQRTDCLLGLKQVYGLDFKKFTPVAIDLRHEVLDKGQADLSIVFTTDPQIRRNGYVLLEDDKGMFPPYNSTLLVKDGQEGIAEIGKVAGQVQKGLTAPVMQELNARVDLDKKTPQQVASEYLKETGLVG
jgi:osmoprotectant transport system substrate-binding protein